MSNDASKELDEWVLEITARLENLDNSHPTKPLQTSSVHNAQLPSITANWQSLDDFGVSNFLPESKKWQFVAYMERWFGLNIESDGTSSKKVH